jgi:hypothetical protein
LADNFNSLYTSSSPGKVFCDLGGASNGIWDGAAGVRLILDSNGFPNAAQNPYYRHLGYTAAGAEALAKPTYFLGNADEENAPIIAKPTGEELAISGSMLQITDMDLMEILNPTATRSDVMGTTGLTFGGKRSMDYTSVAIVFPLEEDPTRYGVFHLYKAYNDAGLAFKISGKAMSENPFAFRDLAISSRAAGDRSARFFKQNAVGS